MDFENLSREQMMECAKERGTILREKRKALGMTQQQVANKANVVLQQYQKFESGKRNIMTCTFLIACRVLEALEIDITEFYRGGCENRD